MVSSSDDFVPDGRFQAWASDVSSKGSFGPDECECQDRRTEKVDAVNVSGGRTLQVMFFSEKGGGDGTNCLVHGEKEDDGSEIKPVKKGEG